MSDIRRLIEVALPLKEVSEQSAREKSIRHGHISTLHICGAQRPLGAGYAAEITPKLEAAAKTNPNLRLAEYAVRIELLPREQEHGD